MSRIKEIKDLLVRYDIKPSAQRIAIMDYLIKYRTHPTAEEIYHALSPHLPTLSRTTVYNTLRLFAEQGALLSLVIDEKNVRYDIDTRNHAHFMCLGCGCVYDVPSGDLDVIHLDGVGDLVITEIHLYYKGYCKKCLEEKLKKEYI